MADTDNRDVPTPMSDGDVSPPAGTAFEPAAPLKDAGVSFDPAPGGDDAAKSAASEPTGAAGATQTLKDGAATLRTQAQDKARLYAQDGKAKATDALGQLSQLLTDAADQVDEKLGAQYGQYARTAAEKVQSFSSTIDAKDVDELVEDARALVRQSPAVAIGVAAGLGFVVARLLTAGLDQRDA